MRTNFYSSENETVRVYFNGEITTVEIVDTNGIVGRGHARHNPADSYSEQFGQALALSRASSRYFKKIEKRLVKGTK